MARNSNFQGISLVPQCRTLAFLNLADLIDYSLISPATRDLVRYHHKRCDQMIWRIGADGDYDFIIYDEFNDFMNGNDFKFSLDVSELNVPEDCIYRKFGCWEVMSQKTLGHVKAYCNKDEAVEILESFSRELLELFRIREHNLGIGCEELTDNLDIFQRLPRFGKVTVFGGNQENELSSEVMDFLMNQLDCDWLHINRCDVDSEYVFDGDLNRKHFSAKNLDWITRESMLRMSCQRVDISEGTDNDPSLLNTLIKEWLTGGLENLELIKTKQFTDDEMEEIMEDIDCVDYDSAIHQGEFGGKDVSDGYYIVRESDGMVATIVNGEDDDNDLFELRGFKWIIWR